MAKDDRLYARFDIGMDEHEKIILLSDAAFRTLFEATFYARRQLTDGFLAEGVVLKKWGKDVAPELTTNHAERPSWVRVDGGWQIHDFAEHQTTNADIQVKRASGRLGGLAKARRAASTSVAPASEVQEQKGSTTLAKTETETETETETTTKETSELRPDVIRLCNLLQDLVVANGSKRPATTDKAMEGWRVSARLMLVADGRDPVAAERLMRWCQADPFWQGNVMSMPKFRAKYDQLRLAANKAIAERQQHGGKESKADRARGVIAQGQRLQAELDRKAIES